VLFCGRDAQIRRQVLQGNEGSYFRFGQRGTYANQKATQLGGKVIAMSDSNGYIVDENGIDTRSSKR
jgi:glutamate dehydrogenase (NADP+)